METQTARNNGTMMETAFVAGAALLAMALLAFGYNSHSETRVAAPSTRPIDSGTPTDARRGQYQPATPGPDTRTAPTQSNTGTGPAAGDTGQGGDANNR